MGGMGRIFTPEGAGWASGDKQEQKARASTKSNEEQAARAPLLAKEAALKASMQAEDEARKEADRKLVVRKRGQYNSLELGNADQANTARKTLLGQ